jgi:ankyrin repeat protein
MNRRVAVEGIKLWKVVGRDGRVWTDVGNQFMSLCQQPKFVDIAVMLVKSRSIDANMEIVLGDREILTPLCIASMKGHLPVVQALLQGGADADKATDYGWTPLYMASHADHVPVVQALLQGGADVDKAAGGGATSLHIASQQGHVPVVHALLQGGADVDKAKDDDGGYTPLIIASQGGHVPVVQALLQGGADMDKATDNGTTPLIMASMKGHPQIVSELLKHAHKLSRHRSFHHIFTSSIHHTVYKSTYTPRSSSHSAGSEGTHLHGAGVAQLCDLHHHVGQ